MNVFFVFLTFFLILLQGCKRTERYEIGSLGESVDFEASISTAIQPDSNLPVLLINKTDPIGLLYLKQEGHPSFRTLKGLDLPIVNEEIKDATFGALRMLEDEENLYTFYWARYAREDVYKRAEEIMKQRKEEEKKELESIRKERKRILEEKSPEEQKRLEAFKKEVQKIKQKYPDLKSEDINKRRQAYVKYIREVREKRKEILGDINEIKKKKLEELRKKEQEIMAKLSKKTEVELRAAISKHIFLAVIDKKNYTLKGVYKVTPDNLFPTADVSVGMEGKYLVIAWTDERVEGSVGVCMSLSGDAKNWTNPHCLKGFIRPKVVQANGKSILYTVACKKDDCEVKFFTISQDKFAELSSLKINPSEVYVDVVYGGGKYHVYTWGAQSFTLYTSKDLKEFSKHGDSSNMTDKFINMLLPVASEKPKAILLLKPINPKSWIGINLDKPNVYMADFSNGKVKLIRLQRNAEHLTTATHISAAVNSRGDIAVVWVDKRFLVPIPFLTFITKDGEIYSDNPLEDPRYFTVDKPTVTAKGEEFIVYYPIKKINMEKEDAKAIISKPYFERVRKLRISAVEFAYEKPSGKSLEESFNNYAKARVKGDEKEAYTYFDPIFKLRLPYEIWDAQKVDIRFKDIKLKKVDVLDHFGQVIYEAHVEFPEQIGKVPIKEREKKYEAIDEVWIYLFGKWYYMPRTPISSIFYAEW